MSESEFIALEVGPRITPSIKELPERFLPQGHIVYAEKRGYKHLSDEMKGSAIQADAEALPLADRSINLVYQRDVFGARTTIPKDKDGKYITAEREQVDVGKVAAEFYRVLKPGGRAVIMEVSTPYLAPLDEIKAAFCSLGFEIEEIYKGAEIFRLYSPNGHPDKKSQILGKGNEDDWIVGGLEKSDNLPTGSYALVLRKT